MHSFRCASSLRHTFLFSTSIRRIVLSIRIRVCHNSNKEGQIIMPFCEKCGNQTSPDSIFCSNCGAKLKTTQIETPPQLYNQQYIPQNNQEPLNVSQPTNSPTNNTQAKNPSTELYVGLNLLSLLIPVLGLILSIVFRNTRPLQASCCKANMILGFLISGVCMIFTLILLVA